MVKVPKRSYTRHLWTAVVVVLLVLAVSAVTAGSAGAYSSYKHDGATSCASCHPGGDTNVIPTDASCTACHTGFASRSVSAARTCWSCHEPGQDMSTVQTGAGCAAGCHGATPHLGSNLQACTSCHGVTQSATDRGTSAHHDGGATDYTAPTCADCHKATHTAYVVGSACTACHAGVEPTHPAAAAMAAPTLAFTATPAIVKYGATTVLAGSLKNGATPLVGTTITLQAKASGAADFADVTTAVTGADGSFSFAAVSPTAAITYRVWAPGAVVAQTTVRPASKSAAVTVSPVLALSLSKTSIALGRKVTAKGTITPLRVGGSVKVVIQKKGATWKTVKTVTRPLDATGSAYSYLYKPLKKGTYRVQASAVATADLLAVKTAWKTFKVK
jgi:hypothetical protein